MGASNDVTSEPRSAASLHYSRQVRFAIPNPAGYHRNVMHSIAITVVWGAGCDQSLFFSQWRLSPRRPQPKISRSGSSRCQADKVEANCAACHSLDYINSPFPNAALWDAEVTKMIKTFGAPIDDADAAIIRHFLSQNYGS